MLWAPAHSLAQRNSCIVATLIEGEVIFASNNVCAKLRHDFACRICRCGGTSMCEDWWIWKSKINAVCGAGGNMFFSPCNIQSDVFFFHCSALHPFHSERNILIRRWVYGLERNERMNFSSRHTVIQEQSHSLFIDLLAWRLRWWISVCCAERPANQNPV